MKQAVHMFYKTKFSSLPNHCGKNFTKFFSNSLCGFYNEGLCKLDNLFKPVFSTFISFGESGQQGRMLFLNMSDVSLEF